MERRADLGVLRATVGEIVAASAVSRDVAGIKLVPDEDGDGDEFLRVEISLKASRKFGDELTILSRKIWDAVDAIDGRFASVRFPDAA